MDERRARRVRRDPLEGPRALVYVAGAIEARRDRVFELRHLEPRRPSIPEIATILGVSVSTVEQDLRHVALAARDSLSEQMLVRLGVVSEALMRIAELAVETAEATKDESLRLAALDQALRATNERIRVLGAAGFLPTPGHPIDLGGAAAQVELDDLSDRLDGDQRQKVLDLVERLAGHGVGRENTSDARS